MNLTEATFAQANELRNAAARLHKQVARANAEQVLEEIQLMMALLHDVKAAFFEEDK